MPGFTVQNTPNVFPTFRYQDAPAAVAWLQKVFGFARRLEIPGPAGTIAHAQLSLGPGSVLLGSAHDDPGNPWVSEKFGAYVFVEQIDEHYARAKANGAEIVRELQSTTYGSREYSVRDLEGNLWSFGTYCPEPGLPDGRKG
jgi:uncharacterized glyoxalase superfamily protein PhnB